MSVSQIISVFCNACLLVFSNVLGYCYCIVLFTNYKCDTFYMDRLVFDYFYTSDQKLLPSTIC